MTILCLCALVINAGAQPEARVVDSTRNHAMAWIVPGALIAVGALTMADSDADEFFISKFEVREERSEHFLNFSSHLDDYLQHAPAAAVFIASMAGAKGRHDLPNQVALYVKSELLMLATVYSLKYTAGETRPDSGDRHSFPSGHTAQAFTAATFLAKEYGHKNIWISVGAYAAATTVGVFRVLNNRHWVSDVIVGAGIGMLSTEVVYRTHRNVWGKHRTSDVAIKPFSTLGARGISLRLSL